MWWKFIVALAYSGMYVYDSTEPCTLMIIIVIMIMYFSGPQNKYSFCNLQREALCDIVANSHRSYILIIITHSGYSM